MSDQLKQLREQAQESIPAFDESLHERTMARVRSARAQATAQPDRSFPRFAIWFGGLAAAACVAVGVWAMLRTRETPQPLLPLIASLGESATPIGEYVAAPIDRATRQLSYLQSDVKDFGVFLKDQLDILPTNKTPDNTTVHPQS